MNKETYMLMEVIGNGPAINGADSWLCPFEEWQDVLIEAFGDLEDPATIRFTVMQMDSDELESYCAEHGIEWNG